MPAESLNIYGIDDNDFASKVAATALAAPDSNRASGAPTGESGAEGNGADERVNNNVSDKISIKKMDLSDDSRANTVGNHGKQG